jgi:hypothetical protein
MPKLTSGTHRPRTSSAATRARRKLVSMRWLAVFGVALLLGGCSRAFWRDQADTDVYQAIGEKVNDPRWAVPRLDITPDPRSRFADPFDPDHSPLPPDDAAAHEYMHGVDGMKGYGGWHKFGDRLTVENPQWLETYGITPASINPATGAYDGTLPALEEVTLSEAVDLSLIHSREYQSTLEDVYLAALDVTFERFQFSVRYLGIGGGEPAAGLNGTVIPDGPPDRLGLDSRFGMSQLLPAGGQIAVELANNTLWLFSPGNTSTATTLSYSLVQPLLFGAGRKVVLENLTQAERDLLYAIRDLGLFRQDFFIDVVGGADGYLGLLQQLQLIRNEQDNIRRLERQVAELQAINTNVTQRYRVPLAGDPAPFVIPESLQLQLQYDADDGELTYEGPLTEAQETDLLAISDDPIMKSAVNELIESIRVVPASLDVLQLQSQLATSRNRARNLQRTLQDSLDSFKILLGLPPDMPFGIDDGLLVQFELIDPRIRALETDVEAFVDLWATIDEENPDPVTMQEASVVYLALAQRVQDEGVSLLDSDWAQLQPQLEERFAELPTEADRNRSRADIASDQRRLENSRNRLKTNLEAAAALAAELATPAVTVDVRADQRIRIILLQEELLQIVRGLTATQIGFRVEQVGIQPFNTPLEEAVAHGIENRLDLMNARAVVMDVRRQVEISANGLMSSLDLVVEGDIRNSGRQDILDFRGDRSDLRFGLRFTAPLDQIQERNDYRASQILYQRARRNYMAQEDAVKQQIRNAWRNLEVLKRNLETSRQAVRIAALQLDSAVEEANAPAEGDGGQQFGLGQQGQALLRALSDVLSAQNSLLGDYISYERTRLNIHRHMGKMDIGPDGLWTDPFYQSEQNAELPPAMPALPPPWWGAHADHRAAVGWLSDSGGGDTFELVAHRAELGGAGEPQGLWQPEAGAGDAGSVSGDSHGAGLRRQPEQQDVVQPGRGDNDDHQYRPRGDAGGRKRDRLRTRFVRVGG